MIIPDAPTDAFRRSRSLRLWIPVCVAMFVLLGSLGLLFIFERHREGEIRNSFEEMARVNAGFIQRTHLVRNATMAERLSEIIGFQVFFWNERVDQLIAPPGAKLDPAVLKLDFNGRVQEISDGRMMVGIKGERGMHLIFIHDRIKGGFSVVSRDAWTALGVFWGLSLGLGLLLSYRVTKPLGQIVRSLPKVGGEGALEDLPLERGDEIGRLARTLHRTHKSLQSERDLRRDAERHAILGRMTASMAHEIRNPVSAIRLHAELLDPDASQDFNVSKRLILSEAERIEDLVGQWMYYSRPEPPLKVELDLAKVLMDAVELIRPQASHAGVELVIRGVENGPIWIEGDGKRLQQVFGNLLLNGIQAMSRGGKLTVEVLEQQDAVEIRISDQGEGFSPSALEHLGEPFYSEKEGGMGLGLAVVKDICEAHGGLLSAMNLDEGGACLELVLNKKSKPAEP